jgi:hypothetical protein
LHAIHLRFKAAYEDIESRHRDIIQNLQYRLSAPGFTAMKCSPDIRALERAEAFYAKNQDYRTAAQIRRQIQRRSLIEAQEFEADLKRTIEAKVRDAIVQHEAEQRTFAQRVQNEKNLLKRDTDRMLLVIENKHRKGLHKLTGKSETSFDLTKQFRGTVHKHIDTDIRDFAESLQATQADDETESVHSEIQPPPPEPRTRSARVSWRSPSRKAKESRRQNPRVRVALQRANRPVNISEKVEAD